MAISRQQLVKELEPGLNALFGLEYKQYADETKQIFVTESSDRAFEEEVMLSGFGDAAVKPEGQGVSFDTAQETYTARYTMETIALAFAITEEAKITERFTRISNNQILYRFFVEDFDMYSNVWAGEMPFRAVDDKIYEYACHEGNYAMANILAGAREEERRNQ
mgnify:CR=1 FL=1